MKVAGAELGGLGSEFLDAGWREKTLAACVVQSAAGASLITVSARTDGIDDADAVEVWLVVCSESRRQKP